MAHPLHKIVGKEIETFFASKSDFEVKLDPACSTKKGLHHIPFFIGTNKSYETQLTNVDILVVKDKKIKVVCEIDESNVKPGHIFGKFLSVVSSDICITYNGTKYNFDDSIIFIQVLSKKKLEPNSKKEEQWDNIEKSIDSNFSSFKGLNISYNIIKGKNAKVQSRKLQSILSSIK